VGQSQGNNPGSVWGNNDSVAETASDLGLPVNMLHRWRRETKLTGRVFPGRGIARDEELAEFEAAGRN
jgi:transposase-like protein